MIFAVCRSRGRRSEGLQSPLALARIFFLKGGCWVMRRGLLWRCKMFDRKERGGG